MSIELKVDLAEFMLYRSMKLLSVVKSSLRWLCFLAPTDLQARLLKHQPAADPASDATEDLAQESRRELRTSALARSLCAASFPFLILACSIRFQVCCVVAGGATEASAGCDMFAKQVMVGLAASRNLARSARASMTLFSPLKIRSSSSGVRAALLLALHSFNENVLGASSSASSWSSLLISEFKTRVSTVQHHLVNLC